MILVASTLFVQSLGFVATGLTLASFAQRSDARLRVFLTLGSLFWAVHFALLEAYTASVTLLFIGSRQAASHWISRGPEIWRQAAAWGYTLGFTVIAGITWQGWKSLLPWLMAVNGTFAFFYLRGARMRTQMLLADVAGAVNGLAVGSAGGFVGSLAFLTVNGWTIVRLRRQERAAAVTDR